MPCWEGGHRLGLRDERDPFASHVALTDWKEKVQRGFTSSLLYFKPTVMDCVTPSQNLVATLHRHYISPSSFPREQEFPAAGSGQVARPSCASGKVNWPICPLQDESRLIVLQDINQGCAYLLPSTGLVMWGMCSPQWLSSAPCAEDVGHE